MSLSARAVEAHGKGGVLVSHVLANLLGLQALFLHGRFRASFGGLSHPHRLGLAGLGLRLPLRLPAGLAAPLGPLLVM